MITVMASVSFILFTFSIFLWIKERNNALTAVPSVVKKNITPVEASMITGDSFSVRHVTATILDLVLKEKLSAERTADGRIMYKDNANRDELKKYEKDLVDYLFYRIGRDGIFFMEDVESVTEDQEERDSFYSFLEKLKNGIKKELRDSVISRRSRYARTFLPVSSFLLMISGAVMLFEHPVSGLAVWTGSATLGGLMLKQEWLTAYGMEEKERFQRYRNYLKNHRISGGALEELAADYVYTTAFGLAGNHEENYPLRDASSLKFRPGEFPLYMPAAGTGAFFIINNEESEQLTEAFYKAGYTDGDTISTDANDDGA
ncbi:MAG: DUF2207 domain-containing protein [Alkalicoccus sp.]|nr:MAG: DUF2207 domain-containing protein [Alkalicoccus sp.]